MKKILLSVFLVSTTCLLHAQNGFWEVANGPYGGNFDLVKTPNETLYATNPIEWTQTYRSINGGETWEQLAFLQQAFPDAVNKVVKIGAAGTVFVCPYSNQVECSWYRTNNDGQTWETIDNSVSDFLERPSGVLVSTQTVGLLRSTDGGQHWDTSLVDNRTLTTVNNPFVGLIATLGVAGPDVIFRSPDDGLSWDTISLPLNYDSYFFTPSGALLCTEFGFRELLRSTDGGESFQPTSLETVVGITATALQNGRILMNAYDSTFTKYRIYYSDDDGINWQILMQDNPVFTGDFQRISPLLDGTVFVNSIGGLHASSNGGTGWQFSGSGMRYAEVTDIKFITDSLFFTNTNLGIWKTEDAGDTWLQLSQNTYNQIGINKIGTSASGGIVLVQDDQLLWSANGTNGFENITPPDSLDYFYNYVFLNPINDHLFANTKKGLERSDNLGQTWSLVFNGMDFSSVAFLPSGRIIAANTDTLMYFSDDNGSTWQSVDDQNLGSTHFMRIAPNGDVYAFGWSNSNYFLWKSEDLGQTWTRLTPNLGNNPPIGANNLDIAGNGHLYRCETYEHVFVSSNEGLTWQTLPSPSEYAVNFGHLSLSPSQHLYISASNILYKSVSVVTQGAYIEGHVNADADADCSTSDAQAPLKNRIVKAEGDTYNYFTNTDPDGHYVFFIDTGAYQVIVQNPSGIWWDYCQDTIAVDLPEFFVTDTADFVAVPLSFCPLMTVNVALPQLRRCFNNEVYVEYCNQGTEAADSAWVDILLDPFLSFLSSAQAHEILGENSIRFFVGDVASGECGQFQLTVYLNCDSTVIGQTHCITAHGFPDTLCTTVPNWSGAEIEASVTCQDTTLQFRLKNIGNGPSQTLDYIIIEDDVVLFSGQEAYEIAEDLVLDVSANGSTWRIESEQEPGHPFSTLALAFTEGCGGFNSLGYINQFPVNGIQPSWHTMCVENVGSFDPNDKQGFPKGVGSEHNIRPGQTIDYLIRFQNTGTDTAFTVEVRDTLSAFLDPSSIRLGASSHPYTWNLSGQGVISFTFNNIVLPDSNVNEVASHGFVQFNIGQHTGLPLGSVIENSAAIYFDFNDPVITNTTFHTIEKSPLTSALRPEPKTTVPELEIWPNPFSERTNIRLEKKTSETMLLKIFDSQGTLISQKTTLGTDIEFNAKNLPNGLFWAEIRDAQGRLLGSGTLVKQ